MDRTAGPPTGSPIVHVALIGLMASGKSTLGRELAHRFGWVFVDVDDLILESTGRTVREIWEQDGEAGYRPLESEAVTGALAESARGVIAVPAGAVLDESVRDRLTDPGVLVVWLSAEPATVAARVHPHDHRPLLGDDPLAVLTKMATQRDGIYRSLADLVVDVDGLSDPEMLIAKGVPLVEQILG